MSDRPWMKFYPRDWRGDQALRVVSIAARGLWMEMLCVMHEASPYGHLLIGGQPVSDAVLSRLAGVPVTEVQTLLVELRDARVYRQTRSGVIYSKRMTDDHKRSIAGRNAKKTALEEASENTEEKPRPSRSPCSTPSTHKPEARVSEIPPDEPIGSSPPQGAEKRGTRLPDDWRPDQEGLDYAVQTLGINVDPQWELDRFRDYWRAVPGAKGRKLDWPATWRNWCRNAADRTPNLGRTHERPHSDAKFLARQANHAAAFEGAQRAAGRDWKP